MADKDYSPLSTSCVRSLNDKLYEKRKVAALEIERMVKEFAASNNSQQIRKLLRVLGQDFARSQNANSRKGGLIGLAATAIALGKESSVYVQELVKPVLACFHDADSRVRYFSCEALYNIVKVARGSVLPFFNDIFDGLSNLAADPDQNVRSGSELLDRLMKDIVTESCAFDMVAFMPLVRGRIYTKNPYARQFIVTWIMTLDSVPDINMIVFLPEILDGLFNILGDPNPEIRKMCESALGEFLQGVARSKPQSVDYPAMVNILITHSQSADAVIQYTAITWLKEFVQLSGRAMLPFASGILTAALPCLSYEEDSRKSTREVARIVNTSLMRLVSSDDDISSETGQQFPPPSLDKEKEDEEESTDVCEAASPNLNIPSVVNVLTRQLIHDCMHTRIAALRWIYHLYIKTPNKIFQHVDELFPLLLKTLSDPSDEVVLLDLEVLAEISSSSAGKKYPSNEDNYQPALSLEIQKAVESSHGMNGYFTKFMLSLLKLFSTDRQLLEDRGSFIIRQLCLLLHAEDIYKCFSEIMLHEEDMKFAAVMIQTLSTILLTSTELFELRTQLKDLKTPESCSLFCCLYKSWCHNPVSTVALCYLTQNYHHACDLLPLFGDLEVTVDFLTEIDKLVQLIESPIFTYLRLQLLDVEHSQHLIKSLYGLLMLLPQTDAFRTLQHRLECIPNIQFVPAEKSVANAQNSPVKRPALKNIKFDELLKHFKTVQERRRAARRQPRTIADLDRKYGYS